MFPETLGILMSGTDQYTHSQLQGSKNKAFPNWHKELCPGCEAGIAELRRKTGSSHLQSWESWDSTKVSRAKWILDSWPSLSFSIEIRTDATANLSYLSCIPWFYRCAWRPSPSRTAQRGCWGGDRPDECTFAIFHCLSAQLAELVVGLPLAQAALCVYHRPKYRCLQSKAPSWNLNGSSGT